MFAEEQRLEEARTRVRNWQRWGPYLADRQWGTVREDYSADGEPWHYFPHDHARSRAYRWGEDGLLGITDRECRLCLGLALWNGRDPILKERLFGLTGPEGNHGEDVKECYYYLDATPTHAYMKALYKYPQAAFPYDALRTRNQQAGKLDREVELADTGVFDENRYFDVFAEYAKAGPDDILLRVTVANRGPEAARLHLLPTLWFRNTWIWACTHEGCERRPDLRQADANSVRAEHATLGTFQFAAGPAPDGGDGVWLFTDNETNQERLFGTPNPTPYVRDAFHRRVVEGDVAAVNPAGHGTKTAVWYEIDLAAGASATVRLRLAIGEARPDVREGVFDTVFDQRIAEADAFYAARTARCANAEAQRVTRQAYAGLLWSKQFYHYAVHPWLKGDPAFPPPPTSRKRGRNKGWPHLFNRDIISMPDKWEYPWYAAWDLAFHMLPMAEIDPAFAKDQLLLFLREWYMHPNGQIPAYEFALGDVNPPVHAWACWRVYKITAKGGERDRAFLARAFQKLLLNFTWWVNRKDPHDRNIFSGGFLGLDNIGVFDRSKPLPMGGHLEQADGTAWMAFYCVTMLAMALELASEDPVYEDIASKFFEHFVAITDAINHLGKHGLWDETDGFYYDQVHEDGHSIPLKVRSLVGLIPLLAVEVLEDDVIERLPGFKKRMDWFLDHRKDLAKHIACMERHTPASGARALRLLAIPSHERLERLLRYLLDESEFLSPYGIRSLSRHHAAHPFSLHVGDATYTVGYVPGDSDSYLFGGNSNWRGPVWWPLNYLIVEALERYHHFYGDAFTVECPVGSGQRVTLQGAADEIARRLCGMFLPDAAGRRPAHGDEARYATDPHWKDLVLFYEFFHGDSGRGLGASHQTGWTALVVRTLRQGHR
jgi:hypothetical protein